MESCALDPAVVLLKNIVIVEALQPWWYFFSKHDSRSSLSETLEVLTCSPNSSIRHVLCILQYKNQSKLQVVASLEVLQFVYCLGFWKV